MCECSQETCRPTGELVVRVKYCFDHARWRGNVEVLAVTVGDQTISLSSGSQEFGPFDSSTEVGYWLQRQAGALRVFTAPEMFQRLAES